MSKASVAKAPRISSTAAQDRAKRRTKLLAFFADPPAAVLAAADELGRAREYYGDDTDRELAEIDAGRHLLQGRRTKTARR